jgi:hypothetical protein
MVWLLRAAPMVVKNRHVCHILDDSGVKINLLHQKWVAWWGLETQAKNTAAFLGPPKFINLG